MTIPFTKMQALGNDFAVIDATQGAFSLSTKQIADMADRRFGVGFDQLLLIESARDAKTDFYYRIFNADGNEVGQCGNGARCVARYVKEKGLINHDAIVLQTLTTCIQCNVQSDNQVSVLIEAPKFDPVDVPFDSSQPASIDVEFDVVNVGNPHAVIVVSDVDEVDLALWGRLLSEDHRFPDGVNVSVMSILSSTHAQLRVFERGVGETQACGSAACAAMVLGREQGFLDTRVKVSQPGGDLEIAWQGADSLVEMLGPAEFVYRGEYLLL